MIALLPPKDLAARLLSVAEEYAVDGQGCVMIVVNWGVNINWDKCSSVSLSATKVTDDDNGDGWLDRDAK